MPRKTNYRFERQERERKKAEKKAARAAAKAEKKGELDPEAAEGDAADPELEENQS
ncbi:MAG: hypothetical protein ACPGRZ_05435 [Alphaproteobacteria bacterium]